MATLLGNANINLTVSPSIGGLVGAVSRFSGDIRSFGGPGQHDKPLNRATDYVQQKVEENFATESAAGDPWAPMADATPFLPYRQRHGQGPLLDVTGRLKRAALAEARWQFDGQGGTAFVPYDTFEGSNAPYGVYQHEGAVNLGLGGGLSDVPPRPFFVVNDDDIDAMEDIFADWMEENFSKTIGGSDTTIESLAR